MLVKEALIEIGCVVTSLVVGWLNNNINNNNNNNNINNNNNNNNTNCSHVIYRAVWSPSVGKANHWREGNEATRVAVAM